MARFVAGLFKGVLGIAFFVLMLASTPAWVYFLFKAAQGGHVLAFLASLVLPPIGVVGGVLLWFGAIWQVETAVSTDVGKLMMQERSMAVIIPLVVERCRWSEIDADDLAAAAKVRDYATAHLRKHFHFDDGDFASGDGYATVAAAKVSCVDQGQRGQMKSWADDARTVRISPGE